MSTSPPESPRARKSISSREAGCMTLFAMFFLLTSMGWSYAYWNQESGKSTRHQLLAARGVQCTGIVTEFHHREGESGSHDTAVYSFTLPGGHAYSRSISLTEIHVAERESVAVRYLPSDPTVSEMVGYEEPGQRFGVLLGVAFCGASLAMIGYVFLRSPSGRRPALVVLILVSILASVAFAYVVQRYLSWETQRLMVRTSPGRRAEIVPRLPR